MDEIHLNDEGARQTGNDLAADMPKFHRVLVLLRLRAPLADGKNVHIVLSKSSSNTDEQDEFLYNEHTCPVNFLGVEVITDGDDMDPHGIFEYVQTIPAPADIDLDNITLDEMRALFSKFEPFAKS